MTEHVVGMYMAQRGERGERAHAALGETLANARVDPVAEDGTFEIRLDAPSRQAALKQVWDAVAAAGADDQINFAEHPDLPEHSRVRYAPGTR
jgi:hypothetical protein